MQALPLSTTASKILFLAEKSQAIETIETRTGSNQDAEQPMTLRATKMTAVLEKILEHSCYTHGGLND